jgi:seryl-tRNA synthetase
MYQKPFIDCIKPNNYLCRSKGNSLGKIDKMLQVAFIRNNKEEVKQRLAVKNFAELNLVDEVLSLDEERKKLQQEFDSTQAKVNSTSKEIGQLMAKGQKEDAEKKKQEVASFKSSLQPISDKLSVVERQLHELLVKLPNLPSDKVPPGKTPTDNIVVRAGGLEPKLHTDALPHWDLIKKYDIVDFETGAKITGSGFPLYKGKGAKLQRALIQYFLDFNTAAGYTEYLPPLMVNEATAYGTGQLPDKEGQMYYMQEDNFYMIPTSEVPVTNIYRDEIVKEESLPIKMTAYSPCFRREAGSFGKDVRGLNRVHQFDKVEIVQLVHPEKSYDVLEEMVSHVKNGSSPMTSASVCRLPSVEKAVSISLSVLAFRMLRGIPFARAACSTSRIMASE